MTYHHMLVSLEALKAQDISMITLMINYTERHTMPDLLGQRASELDITVEQLVKRFINEGMRDYKASSEPIATGESLDDFFVQNGALKPK